MENLAQTQNWLRWVITHPLGVRKALTDHLNEPKPRTLDSIVDAAPLDRESRLDIYAEGYFSRLVEVLGDDFEHLQKLLTLAFDEMAFRKLVSAYLASHPSQTRTVGEVGQFLPAFVADYAPLKDLPYCTDIAHMDWLATRSIYVDTVPAFDPQSLATLTEDDWDHLKFRLDPTLHFLSSDYSIDRIWMESTMELGHIEKQPTELLIYRRDELVHVEKVSSMQTKVLQRMLDGHTLGEICDDLEETEAPPIMKWFSQWVANGVIRGASLLTLLFVVSLSSILTPSVSHAESIEWQPWTDDLFTRATNQKKLVILDLEAVWCHWCHVMEEKTYHDPKVIREIRDHYIAVKVDQDSRPDISGRFEDFGWPATILFDSKGKVLARRSGFIEPQETLGMLQAFVSDPTPGPSATDQTEIHFAPLGPLSKKQRAAYVHLQKESYDYKDAGWKVAHKFLDTNLAEYWLNGALNGDSKDFGNYKNALDKQLLLLDPAWGGFYQYSAEEDWKHPHFEKIMSIQAENLRAFSMALTVPKLDANRLKKYRSAADQTIQFVDNFLTSPEGAFYVSQDADVVQGEHAEAFFALSDQQRRKIGIPKVDKHIYARENGWMIGALLDNYAATGDLNSLKKAKRATKWILDHRRSGHLFKHDEVDVAGPFLGDNVSMASAFLKLYLSTGDREWFKEANSLAKAIRDSFTRDSAHPGLSTTVITKKDDAKPLFDDNFKAARFFNALSYDNGNQQDKSAATAIFSYLAGSQFSDSIYASAAILILDNELANPPLHIVISGPKTDPVAAELFTTALAHPRIYKNLEWWDKAEGPLPNPDDSYPTFAKPAAFVCADHRCSFPAYKPTEIALRVKQLTGY